VAVEQVPQLEVLLVLQELQTLVVAVAVEVTVHQHNLLAQVVQD
jgi:hypothetical protein